MKKPVKKKKTTVKKPKNRKKSKFSEGIKAFLLVVMIIAVSALISCAVIMAHSSFNKENETQLTEDTLNEVLKEENLAENAAVITEEKPVISVSVQQPEETQTQSPARNTTQTPASNAAQVPPAANENVSLVTSTAARPHVRPVENAGILVFVIDDAGNNLRELEAFLRVPGPLTIAVLPGLPNSAEAARRIRAAGKEAILHQPMEALGAQDPGPGAIYSGMSAGEIREILARNIAEVGPVRGMNNHQGSKITMDREAMQVILEFCKENNLYFLDSRTTADTVVSAIAETIGLKTTERNVFIDNEQNREAMLRYITTGLTRSRRTGSVVMIGHTWSPDLAPLLTEQFPILTEQGYTIKTALDIIE